MFPAIQRAQLILIAMSVSLTLTVPGRSAADDSAMTAATVGRSSDRTIARSIPMGRSSADPGPTIGRFPHQIMESDRDRSAAGLPPWQVTGWSAYAKLWEAFSEHPDDVAIRRYLGLPVGSSNDQPTSMSVSRGRSAPRWLGWRRGSYRQIETPHLQIFTRADAETSRQVAADLERVYWVWTQVFFPLWEAQTQVAQHFAEVSDRSSLLNRLESNRPRLSSRHRMRIVLFADSQQYAATLGRSIPGIEQSTGFYSDERRTSFFYPDDSADAAATRRHELVHQLFREATRSTRTSPLPGRTEDFWLVEGIAGYFESLHFENNRATLGGWDSPRLQFARFRVLSQRDMLPFAELIAGGQRQVQARSDLPRWYAHAIAQTHHLFDGPDDANRRWIYQQLAKLYQVDLEVPGASPPEDAERALVNFLKLDDPTLQSNPTQRSLRQLCLAGCEVTAAGLLTIPPSESLTWLDLSRLPIRTADVRRLCPNPHRLNQLSLEATRVDDSLAEWLAMAIDLQELDLSWTRCGDQTLNAVTHFSELQTVWLTGSNVSDQSVAAAMQFDNLQAIDLQRTTVTAAGLARLRRARPSLKINPLQLRFETGSQ